MANNISKYDWNQIEAEFTAGYFLTDPETGRIYHKYPTHEELVEKYGCSIHTIRQRSCVDKWSLKREILQNKIKETLTERKISGLLSESAKFDSVTLDKISKMHRILDIYLKQFSVLFNDDLNIEELNDDERPFIKMTDFESATRVLERLQIIARRTLGEPVQGLTDLSEEITALNSAAAKSDTKSRKSRIKQLSKKINRKDELKAEIEAKRLRLIELEELEKDNGNRE